MVGKHSMKFEVDELLKVKDWMKLAKIHCKSNTVKQEVVVEM